jgi:hypothetical protein
VLAWSLILGVPLSYAGDLNAEVSNMFNNLGAVGNYTAPGAFKGQTFNTYAGGNLYWNYVELSNGGGYMVPTDAQSYDMCVEDNHFDGRVPDGTRRVPSRSRAGTHGRSS